MMGRPIREWGIVRAITKKVPKLAGEVAGGIVEVITGENPVEVVKERISKKIKEDKEISQSDKNELIKQLEETMSLAQLEYKDRVNARQTEVDRLKHGKSWLAQNFLYIFSLFLLLIGTGMIIMMFFFHIPEQNEDMIKSAVTIYYTVGLFGMFQYFFGDVEKNRIGR